MLPILCSAFRARVDVGRGVKCQVEVFFYATLTVSDLDTLVTYFTGVMDRTHHAPNVDAVALALLGAVLWRKRLLICIGNAM